MDKKYHKHNFHKHTFCIFSEVKDKAIENGHPDYKSKSGSSYYFTEEGVYRVANHWGRAANCRWKLVSNSIAQTSSKAKSTKVGFAKWTDFYPYNDHENLFYIAVDFETKTVDFFHKLNPLFDGKSVCRNAADTAKRVKICKEVLLEDNWSKYLKYNNLDALRLKTINELLTTNNSFIAIKRNFIH